MAAIEAGTMTAMESPMQTTAIPPCSKATPQHAAMTTGMAPRIRMIAIQRCSPGIVARTVTTMAMESQITLTVILHVHHQPRRLRCVSVL